MQFSLVSGIFLKYMNFSGKAQKGSWDFRKMIYYCGTNKSTVSVFIYEIRDCCGLFELKQSLILLTNKRSLCQIVHASATHDHIFVNMSARLLDYSSCNFHGQRY